MTIGISFSLYFYFFLYFSISSLFSSLSLSLLKEKGFKNDLSSNGVNVRTFDTVQGVPFFVLLQNWLENWLEKIREREKERKKVREKEREKREWEDHGEKVVVKEGRVETSLIYIFYKLDSREREREKKAGKKEKESGEEMQFLASEFAMKRFWYGFEILVLCMKLSPIQNFRSSLELFSEYSHIYSMTGCVNHRMQIFCSGSSSWTESWKFWRKSWERYRREREREKKWEGERKNWEREREKKRKRERRELEHSWERNFGITEIQFQV